ncbi:MAG: glycosyltransferase [Candidatus Moranbacteria bacterium]|nr:glycosyltransferase [Candidatus Moranbacteria bacterium]
MRIGIDARLLDAKLHSGVEEYTINLLESIFKQDRANTYILFYNAFNKELPDFITAMEKYPNVFVRRLFWPNKILNFLLFLFKYPKIDRLLDVPVLFTPNLNFTAWSRACKHLLTIHDFSFKIFPEFFDLKRKIWHWLVAPKKLIEKSDLIFTVSKTGQRDILNFFTKTRQKVLKSKFRILYPIVDQQLKPVQKPGKLKRVLAKYQLNPGYLLVLGTFEPRKNLGALITAYAYLRKKGHTHTKLVITGKQGWLFKKTLDLIRASKFRNSIVFTGPIHRQDRSAIYSGAKLFIFPSIYEGFGYPPLEAMACSTPVISSQAGSLPEILGKSALYFNPFFSRELAQAIIVLQKEKAYAKLLIQAGKKRVAKFQNNKSGRKFLKFVNQAINNRPGHAA